MDKFFIERKKVNDESVAESNNSKTENKPIASVRPIQSVQGVQSLGTVRKYQDSYLNFGFTYSGWSVGKNLATSSVWFPVNSKYI
jgi:hypothetical protein